MPFPLELPRRVVAGLLLLLACSCSHTTGGDGLCSLLGPCGTFSQDPVPLVVGFPLQRVDNNEGRLSPGDTLSLYVVNVAPTETACTAHDTLRTAVRWAVSDTSVAEMVLGPRGEGRVRAKKAGTFGVVMYTPYTGQIPVGALVGPIYICPGGPITISAIRVTTDSASH
jgi:hypothetical protein